MEDETVMQAKEQTAESLQQVAEITRGVQAMIERLQAWVEATLGAEWWIFLIAAVLVLLLENVLSIIPRIEKKMKTVAYESDSTLLHLVNWSRSTIYRKIVSYVALYCALVFACWKTPKLVSHLNDTVHVLLVVSVGSLAAVILSYLYQIIWYNKKQGNLRFKRDLFNDTITVICAMYILNIYRFDIAGFVNQDVNPWVFNGFLLLILFPMLVEYRRKWKQSKVFVGALGSEFRLASGEEVILSGLDTERVRLKRIGGGILLMSTDDFLSSAYVLLDNRHSIKVEVEWVIPDHIRDGSAHVQFTDDIRLALENIDEIKKCHRCWLQPRMSSSGHQWFVLDLIVLVHIKHKKEIGEIRNNMIAALIDLSVE